MKVVPVTVGPVRASGVPPLDSCASTTSNERSDGETAGPNSTMQINSTLVPAFGIGLGLLVTIIEDGAGTDEVFNFLKYLLAIIYFTILLYVYQLPCAMILNLLLKVLEPKVAAHV